MNSPRIVVFGSTGYTGRLVARELVDRALPSLLTARDPKKLDRLTRELGSGPGATLDVTEADDVCRLLRPGDVVINCAGPFTDLGEPAVRATIEAGAHYLDTTGEQRFMKRVHEQFDSLARSAGVVVVNAMAFEYALGDTAASVAAEGLERPLRSVDVVYGWGAVASSRGTRRTILRILESGGLAYADGDWCPEPAAVRRRRMRVSGERKRAVVSFPSGEVVTVPRRIAVERVRGWIAVGSRTAALARLVSPALPWLVRLADPVLEPLLRRGPEGPSPEERRESRFTIAVEAEGADGAGRRVVVQGRDPYGLTAAIAAGGARRLLEDPPQKAGVLGPAEIVEPRAFLDGLRGHGVRWSVEDAR